MECNCGEFFDNEGVECHCVCCWVETCAAHNCEKCIEKELIRLGKLKEKQNGNKN